jgi:hypothetical protein
VPRVGLAGETGELRIHPFGDPADQPDRRIEQATDQGHDADDGADDHTFDQPDDPVKYPHVQGLMKGAPAMPFAMQRSAAASRPDAAESGAALIPHGGTNRASQPVIGFDTPEGPGISAGGLNRRGGRLVA